MANCGIGKRRARQLTRRGFLGRVTALGGATALGGVAVGPYFFVRRAVADSNVVRVLSWGGNVGPDVVAPFTERTGITVEEKSYAVDEEMIALLQGSPAGSFDLVGADAEYQFMLRDGSFVEPLDPQDYPLKDYWPRFQQLPQHWHDGKLYALATSFGYNGIVYNAEKVTRDQAQSYQVAWSDSLKGKVTLNDWYLNSMLAMSLTNGNRPPNQLDAEQFAGLKKTLFSLGPQLSGIGVWAAVFSQLANGEAWVIPGVGDWVALSLRHDGHPIESTVPEEGGTQWVEGYSMVKNSENKDNARKLLQYLASPEGQVRLQTKQSYFGASPSLAAWKKMNTDMPEMAELLRHRLDKPNLMTDWDKGNIFQRDLPTQQTIQDWTNVWIEFKNTL